jgi:hypothetical protein
MMPNRANRRRAKSKKRGGTQKAHSYLLGKINAEQDEKKIFEASTKARIKPQEDTMDEHDRYQDMQEYRARMNEDGG